MSAFPTHSVIVTLLLAPGEVEEFEGDLREAQLAAWTQHVQLSTRLLPTEKIVIGVDSASQYHHVQYRVGFLVNPGAAEFPLHAIAAAVRGGLDHTMWTCTVEQSSLL